MELTKAIETDILQAYYRFWEANLSADMKSFSSYLVDEFSIFGSANGEVFFNKKDAVNFYAATADELRDKAQLRNRNISFQSVDDNSVVALELSDLYVLIGEEWTFYGHARISCVINYINNEWKAVHQHASFPDHRTEEGQQLATDKIEQENLELREAVKRRTVELEQKNRELEIEASLEKVRAVAMGMMKREDMLEVCRAISLELGKLGIEEMRNVQTAIFYDDKGTYMTYEYYAKNNKFNITDTSYTDHAILKDFAHQMLKGKGQCFSTHISENELADWIAYQKKANVYVDDYLITASSLSYHWHSLGPVALGISFYTPPKEEDINLFNRFLKVFELAYRRYLDIEQANAQAREAQIEAAVERVRTQSMAMHQTADLHKVNQELYNQLQWLKVEGLTGVSIYFLDDDGEVRIWDLSSPGSSSNPNSYSLSFNAKKFPVLGEFWEHYKRRESYLTIDYPLERLKAIAKEFQEIDTLMANAFQQAIDNGSLTHQWNAFGNFSNGFLGVDLVVSPTPDVQAIVVKMAGAFKLAYKRFLDLQNAEAQAKEARIETALERVRAVVMAMKKSDELIAVCEVMYKELLSLGFTNIRNAQIAIENDSRESYVFYVHSDFEQIISGEVSYNSSPIVQRLYKELGNSGEGLYEREYSPQEMEEWRSWRHSLSPLLDEREATVASLCWYMYAIGKGNIGISTFNPITKAQIEIVKRFKNVFALSYQRFDDLQAAEAHALQAEKDLVEIKSARKKAEEALVELRLTQKQLVQSEKMASLGELTAGIAHEIQNPLNFVNNFSEVSKELIDELKIKNEELKIDDAEVKDLLNDIIQNLEKITHHGKRADAIVKGMLQHSRASSGKKEPTDINALVDEYLRLAYHGLRAKEKSFNATLETDYDASIGTINVIQQDIGRVILNLITNAFYAVDEKRKSGIEGFEPTITLRTKKLGDKVEISVADNGNGIPKSIINKIFQPFFTTKPTGEGTGLGLSLAYDIISKGHSGELRVETEENKGTTLIIQLPIKD